MRFDGQAAFITGAGAGIGRATSLRLASEGAGVLCFDKNGAAAEETVGQIRAANGRALAAEGDVRERATIEAARDAALAEFGALQYLVNNAGVVTMHGLAELTEERWDFVLDINLKGVYLVTQAVAPAIAQGGGGAVVNLSTVEAEVVVASGPSCQPHYNASKGGVKMLTKALAHELAGQNIRVNCVAPGPIQTQFAGIDWTAGAVHEFLARRMLIPRPGQPEEIAAAIAFLLSDDARFITGIQLPVDGGYLVH